VVWWVENWRVGSRRVLGFDNAGGVLVSLPSRKVRSICSSRAGEIE